MTLTELGEHIRRFDSRVAFVRALGCARSTLNRWAYRGVNIPPVWADRIRALPAAAPKDASAEPTADHDPRQLSLAGERVARS
jgi:hypothetical protein